MKIEFRKRNEQRWLAWAEDELFMLAVCSEIVASLSNLVDSLISWKINKNKIRAVRIVEIFYYAPEYAFFHSDITSGNWHLAAASLNFSYRDVRGEKILQFFYFPPLACFTFSSHVILAERYNKGHNSCCLSLLFCSDVMCYAIMRMLLMLMLCVMWEASNNNLFYECLTNERKATFGLLLFIPSHRSIKWALDWKTLSTRRLEFVRIYRIKVDDMRRHRSMIRVAYLAQFSRCRLISDETCCSSPVCWRRIRGHVCLMMSCEWVESLLRD